MQDKWGELKLSLQQSSLYAYLILPVHTSLLPRIRHRTSGLRPACSNQDASAFQPLATTTVGPAGMHHLLTASTAAATTCDYYSYKHYSIYLSGFRQDWELKKSSPKESFLLSLLLVFTWPALAHDAFSNFNYSFIAVCCCSAYPLPSLHTQLQTHLQWSILVLFQSR